MTEAFISLTVISFIATVVPFIARIIPRQVVPETVLLIVAGALLGPNMLNIIDSHSQAIEILSELGCAFLFLLAGYEIEPKMLTGRDGKKGFVTWVATFIIAILVAIITPDIAQGRQGMIGTALLFTTTALGTLMPILKERQLTGTRVGDLIISYGTWGELATVLAMAILLSSRSTWKTALILGLLVLICVWIGFWITHAQRREHAVYRFIMEKAETTSQPVLRLTILVLVMLVAFSSIFDLDIVLGAFAGGFVLRFVSPEDNEVLESKLEGIAHGFLIPLFFVVSGCAINLKAVTQRPALLLLFILALILVRTIPIVVSLSLDKGEDKLPMHNRLSVAFYSTTALPLIVAITGLEVNRGLMSSEIASVLVAAGAITVFLMPYLGAVTYRVVDAEPIHAMREIWHSPKEVRSILHRHIELERERAKKYREVTTRAIVNHLNHIENKEERQAIFDTLQRQRTEIHSFNLTRMAERKDLWRQHKEELTAIYGRYHDGNNPDVLFLKSIEEHLKEKE